MLTLLYDGERSEAGYEFLDMNYLTKYSRRKPAINYKYAVNLQIRKIYDDLVILFDRAGISKDVIKVIEVPCYGNDCGSVKNEKVNVLQFQLLTN